MDMSLEREIEKFNILAGAFKQRQMHTINQVILKKRNIMYNVFSPKTKEEHYTDAINLVETKNKTWDGETNYIRPIVYKNIITRKNYFSMHIFLNNPICNIYLPLNVSNKIMSFLEDSCKKKAPFYELYLRYLRDHQGAKLIKYNYN
jgi:hypothetical protein